MKKRKRNIVIIITIPIAIISIVVGVIISAGNTPHQGNEEVYIPTDGSNTPNNDINPTVSIWHQFEPGSPESNYLEALVGESHPSLPDFNIELRSYPGITMRNQLLAAKQDGTLPHAVFINPEWLPELVRLDILSALDTRADYSEVSGRLLEGALETGRRGAHFYGLPFSVTSKVLVYNPFLITEASLPSSFSPRDCCH